MHIRKLADYHLLLVAIPEDTRKSEPTNQKKISLKPNFDMIFIPDSDRNF